jgi:ectoine hydroxylase-related dioxygenase (phytanoyl-CoA dioxygenase family)
MWSSGRVEHRSARWYDLFVPVLAEKQQTGVTRKQKKFWDENGYLILPGFFSRAEVEAVNAVVEQRVANPASFGQATVDPLWGDHAGKRFRAVEAPREVFGGPIKINDLFLDEAAVRNLALSERLTKILSGLLGGAPLICNSLNFIWGSGQPDHVDSWFMPAPVPRTLPMRTARWWRRTPAELPDFNKRLAVSSICLEDVQPNAGPLVYYPGSHKIPPFRFPNGGYAALQDGTQQSTEYVHDRIKKAGLHREEFLGKAGDVFLWHGQLVHGGSPIADPARTRKTLVTHYWRAADVKPENAVKVHETGYYERRQHQQIRN